MTPEPPVGCIVTDDTGHVFERRLDKFGWWTCACDKHEVEFDWSEVLADIGMNTFVVTKP